MNTVVTKLRFAFTSSARERQAQNASDLAASVELLRKYRESLLRCTRVCEEAARGDLEMRLLNADECGDFSPLMQRH
jgi:hypothetical protein